jgi:hypothetical protein
MVFQSSFGNYAVVARGLRGGFFRRRDRVIDRNARQAGFGFSGFGTIAGRGISGPKSFAL